MFLLTWCYHINCAQVWNRNKIIAGVLAVLMLGDAGVAIAGVTTITPVENTCYAVFVSLSWMSSTWIVALVFDFVTFVSVISCHCHYCISLTFVFQ